MTMHDDDHLALAPLFDGGTPRAAVSIKPFSAFHGEDEYVLAPGTRLEVTDVRDEGDGLCLVRACASSSKHAWSTERRYRWRAPRSAACTCRATVS
jgi:hypothetical protein